MIKKWIDFINENIVNPDSYIDIRMQELRDLISNISTSYKFSWENTNDEKLTITFDINGMSVKYTFDILSMNITKYVGESIDFDIDVESIDGGLNEIDTDIKSLIGISESIIENIHWLIEGNKYKVQFPCYDDYDEGLEPEVIILEVVRKLKNGYLMLDVDSGEKFEYSFNILEDCIIEDYEIS